MGRTFGFVVIGVVLAGCASSAPSTQGANAGATPRLLEGDVDLRFGDCARAIPFVSGPRPTRFAPDYVPEEPVKSADDGQGGSFASLTGTGDVSSGFSDDDVYGGLLGNEAGELEGGFGFGRAGYGPGGEGTGWGTIGTGRYGTIGHGSGTGSGYGTGKGSGGMKGRSSAAPSVSVGQPAVTGDLDKAIIRRYIKRNSLKLKYCYEKQLLVNPALAGTVTIKFTITGKGEVSEANGTGVDAAVASCAASVIKDIEFPKPRGGGKVTVQYPITFRPGDGTAASATKPAASADADDESGGTGTAMALDEGKMGRKDSDRAEGQYKMKKRVDASPAADARLDHAQPHEPGTDNPLRALAPDLVACFRLQAKRHGVAVIDIAPDALVAHGIEHPAFQACVGKLASKLTTPAQSAQRCSIAFGPMSIDEAPAIEITGNAITFTGAHVADPRAVMADDKLFKIDAVYERAAERVKSLQTSKAPVMLYGPLVLRALDTTPMGVVNKTITSVRAAGDELLLASQRDGRWKLLREIPGLQLPVVPVPRGTGTWWETRPLGALGIEEERVRISVLVQSDRMWIGLSRVNEFQEITGRKWQDIEAALRDHKAGAYFLDRSDIELAAASDVTYGDVVKMVDIASRVGFTGWRVVHPEALSARPMQ